MCPYDTSWSCLSKLSGDMSIKYTTNKWKSLCHLLQTDMKLYEQCSHGPSGLLLPSMRALPLIEACYLNTLLSALSPCAGKILCIDCLTNCLHRSLSPEFPQTLSSNIRLCFPWRWNLAGFPCYTRIWLPEAKQVCCNHFVVFAEFSRMESCAWFS